MRTVSRYSGEALLVLVVFPVVFAGACLFYLHEKNISDIRQFKTHGAIITDDLWALNDAGARSYLQLAARANHYKTLSLTLDRGDLFLQVHSPPLQGLDALLQRLHLIWTKKLSTGIVYRDRLIGTLHGEQYVRVIYPLLNIFLVLLLVMLLLLFLVRSLSYRKLLEQQVRERTRSYRESERRFHDLVHLLPEMVCETDSRGRLTFANEIALKRFAIPHDAVDSRTCFDLVVPEQRRQIEEHFDRVLQGQDQGLTKFTARGDKDHFPVLIRSAPIFRDDQVGGIRSILIDITERQALEEQLRRDQKMKAIGAMAGGVAHDLNNILSGVINYPELILMQLDGDSAIRSYVEAIRSSGMRAAEVVADLLTVARGVAAGRTVASLNELVREHLESPECARLRSLYPEVTIATDLDQETANIFCSTIHVKKCLMNLLLNGAEAIDGTGRITISTRNRKQDNTSWSVLRVQDTGSGISPEDMEHIFEPFYTRKVMGRSGTGLGLSVVWNTMQDHGGEVRVKSDTSGSRFDLWFPSTDRKAETDPAETVLARVRGKGESILIIDDEMLQQDIALQLLGSLGYRVVMASSGEEALRYLEKHRVDLLIIDMLMPPGMNGYETYRKVLEIHPGQKAIIASGFSKTRDVLATLELGAGAFIRKPYTMEQLAETVYKVLYKDTAPPSTSQPATEDLRN
ncbi:response regulator [Thermodesulfobacteriota bacterium B35]